MLMLKRYLESSQHLRIKHHITTTEIESFYLLTYLAMDFLI